MKVKVRVPATSANLGPGFDSAGLAVTLYNTFVFELLDGGLEIEGCPARFCNEHNMVYRAFCLGAKECGLEFHGLRIECENDVPFTRGLGSSSTCIVAGLVGAFAFQNRSDDKQAILQLATQMEGHPDNVAPAIFGGMTVSAITDQITTLNIPMKNHYRFLALIPPFTLSTEKSRSVLPQRLSREDAVKNVSNVSLLFASFINGYDEGLKFGFQDYLHQPYRGKLIEGYESIMYQLKQDSDVLGAYLSGAGPTIMVVLRESDANGKERIVRELGYYINDWEVKELFLDTQGYTCEVE